MILLNNFLDKYENIVKMLCNAAANNRLAHAYLLHSDNLKLRNDFALALAQLLACKTPQDNGMPCGNCAICLQLARKTYSDLYELSPVGKMRQIRVGDKTNPDPNTYRWFERFFYLTSINNGRKIGLVTDADRLNKEAQNAFLKTLEEPPSGAAFILATNNPAALLPTTVSRCQILTVLSNRCDYDFAGADKLFQILSTLFFNGKNNIVEAEAAAEGIIAISKTLREQAKEKLEDAKNAELEVLEDAENYVIKAIEQRYNDLQEAEYANFRTSFLDAIHCFYAQLFYLAQGAEKNKLANPEILDAVVKIDNLEEDRCFKALEFAQKLNTVLRWQVNEALAFRSFCMNVAFKA